MDASSKGSGQCRRNARKYRQRPHGYSLLHGWLILPSTGISAAWYCSPPLARRYSKQVATSGSALLDPADLIDRPCMKLLKTIRFDASDERVFDLAAAPEEWAVSGAFAFTGTAPNSLTGIANGFLGLPSLGRSTFTTVADATAADIGQIEQVLTGHFISACLASDEAAARFAAAEETSLVRELCRDVPINAVFTVRRTGMRRGRSRRSSALFVRQRASRCRPRSGRWSMTKRDL
jgi:Family of unknown function (DUF6505)